MNKDDDLNNEKMVEKCCSCAGWGSRSGTKKRWARPTLTPTPPLLFIFLNHHLFDHHGAAAPPSPPPPRYFRFFAPNIESSLFRSSMYVCMCALFCFLESLHPYLNHHFFEHHGGGGLPPPPNPPAIESSVFRS